MKKTYLVTLFLAVALMLISHWEARGVVAQGQRTDAVKKLLMERLDTLRSIERILERSYRQGDPSAGSKEIHRAVTARLAAELDLAESKEARIEIRRTMAERARVFEQGVTRDYADGHASKLDLLGSKVRRLEAEIAVEREEGRS